MQAAGLKINENQYIDWGSDIGYLKCWRSISENLRGYIKHQTQCFSRHILIRWSWSTFFNPRFGVLSRKLWKLDRTLCLVFDVMVSKPWIRSLTLIPPRFSFTGLHVKAHGEAIYAMETSHFHIELTLRAVLTWPKLFFLIEVLL